MSNCSSSSDEFWEDQWLGQGRVEGEEVADHLPQHLRGEAGGEEGGEGHQPPTHLHHDHNMIIGEVGENDDDDPDNLISCQMTDKGTLQDLSGSMRMYTLPQGKGLQRTPLGPSASRAGAAANTGAGVTGVAAAVAAAGAAATVGPLDGTPLGATEAIESSGTPVARHAKKSALTALTALAATDDIESTGTPEGRHAKKSALNAQKKPNLSRCLNCD